LPLFIIKPAAHILVWKLSYTQFYLWAWIKVCCATTHKTVYKRREQISCSVWACYHSPNCDWHKMQEKLAHFCGV